MRGEPDRGQCRDERLREEPNSALFCAAVRRFDDLRCRAGLARLGGGLADRPARATRCGSSSRALVADVTVHDILPSDRPARVRLSAARAALSGVPRQRHRPRRSRRPRRTRPASRSRSRASPPTGDAYEPRNTDAPDALQYAHAQRCPPGATVNGGVWWDCYRDLVSNVVLLDKMTGPPGAVECGLSSPCGHTPPPPRRSSRTRRRRRTNLSAGVPAVGDRGEHRGVHRGEPDRRRISPTTWPTLTAWCSPPARMAE